MPRVKGGTKGARRRKKVLEGVKGQRGARSKLLRTAKEALARSLAYTYRDRKVKRRVMRSLWITRINAAARELGTTYNKLVNGLSKNGINIDRKILADLAVNDKSCFSQIVQSAQ